MEFRAGKMIIEGKKVIPDSRKGLVRIGRVWGIQKKAYLIWFVIFVVNLSLTPSSLNGGDLTKALLYKCLNICYEITVSFFIF